MKSSKKIMLLLLLTAITVSISHAQNRVVLIEQFSNSSCPPCGAISPSVYAFANNNQNDVAVIAYHTQFPYNNDSMYFENPVEATQRVNYYSVAGVPNSVLDGNVFNGSTNSFFPNISALVNARLSVVPRYKIEASLITLNGKQLSGSVRFTSLDPMNAANTLVAHVVVIEKNVLKSSYAATPGVNNETEYGYVMRKMLPNASGTALINTAMNGSDTVNLNWTLNNIKNINELRIVAFVQNNSNKEIYQTVLYKVSEPPVGIHENTFSKNLASIYPNPTANEFTVHFKTPLYIKSLTVLDQVNKVIFEEPVNTMTDTMTRALNLNPGLYFVKIETTLGTDIQKVIITP